jgi:ABC-type sulfate transport system permease component
MSFLGATLLLDESSRETARLYGDPVTQAVVQMDFSQLMGIVLAVVFVSLPFAVKRPHSRKVIESSCILCHFRRMKRYYS